MAGFTPLVNQALSQACNSPGGQPNQEPALTSEPEEKDQGGYHRGADPPPTQMHAPHLHIPVIPKGCAHPAKAKGTADVPDGLSVPQAFSPPTLEIATSSVVGGEYVSNRLYMYAFAQMFVCRCVCVPTSMEARGQIRLSLLRWHPSCFVETSSVSGLELTR